MILFSIPVLASYADTEIDELFVKGTDAFQNFRFSEAISYYDKVLEINPNHEDALSNKGAVLFQLGKLEEAIPYFDKVLEINPNHIGALNNKGSVLVELKRSEEAIPYFDKVLEINPNDLYALSNKGDAFFQLHNMKDALSSYQTVLKIEPDYDFSRVEVVDNSSDYQSIEGKLETVVYNSEGQFVTYLVSEKFHVLDNPWAENEINSWTLKETITRDGKKYDVLQIISQHTSEEDTFPGSSGFTITLQKKVNSDTEVSPTKKIWLVRALHNVYPIKTGDFTTNIYTVFRPVE